MRADSRWSSTNGSGEHWPQDHPVIEPHYLTDQEDVDTLVAGVKEVLKLLDTKAMKNVGAKLWEVKE